MSRAALGWVAILGALALTLLASSPFWPGAEVLDSVPGRDKTGHFLIMGALGAACVVAFAGRRLRGRVLSAPVVLALVAGAVTVDEAVQAFVPSRSFSGLDWIASLAGVLIIGGLAALIDKHRQPGGATSSRS